MMTETSGSMDCTRVGKDGEKGCTQHMPESWKLHSKQVLGYVAELNDINEKYVSTLIIENYIEKGYSEKDIFLTWNQGNRGKCKKGTNKNGNAYNSCAYLEKALAYHSK